MQILTKASYDLVVVQKVYARPGNCEPGVEVRLREVQGL